MNSFEVLKNQSGSVVSYFNDFILKLNFEVNKRRNTVINLLLISYLKDDNSVMNSKVIPRDIFKEILSYLSTEKWIETETRKNLDPVKYQEFLEKNKKSAVNSWELEIFDKWFTGTKNIFYLPRNCGKTYSLCKAAYLLAENYYNVDKNVTYEIIITSAFSRTKEIICRTIYEMIDGKYLELKFNDSISFKNKLNLNIKINFGSGLYSFKHYTTEYKNLIGVFFDEFECILDHEKTAVEDFFKKPFLCVIQQIPVPMLSVTTLQQSKNNDDFDTMDDIRG